MENEKKITIEISEKLYNLFLEQTSDESRRKFLEPEDWDDIEDLEKEKNRIEEELKKKISFEEFVWDRLDDVNDILEANKSLAAQLESEMDSNHLPSCTCDSCEEIRDFDREVLKENLREAEEERWRDELERGDME